MIRLCRVWLGPGLSSQKFSVTWDLGGGPRPWKYLAKSERERVKVGRKKEKGENHRQGGNREEPIMVKEVAVGPLGDQGHSRNCRVKRLLCARNARNQVATHPCAERRR